MSSAHIYGDPPQVVCTEDSPFGYGLAPTVAQAWEAEFRASALPTQRGVILRTSFVLGRDLGAGGGALTKLKLLARLGLGGGFPVHGEAVRNRTKIGHPLVDCAQRNLISGAAGWGGQNGTNPSHLPIIRGRLDGKQKGVGKGGGSGKREEEADEEKGLFHGGVSYSGYSDYNYYSNARASLWPRNYAF